MIFKDSCLSGACGIELDGDYVVTGGSLDGGWEGTRRVTQYGIKGNYTDLPDLLTGRFWHACSKFINHKNQTVSFLQNISNVFTELCRHCWSLEGMTEWMICNHLRSTILMMKSGRWRPLFLLRGVVCQPQLSTTRSFFWVKHLPKIWFVDVAVSLVAAQSQSVLIIVIVTFMTLWHKRNLYDIMTQKKCP